MARFLSLAMAGVLACSVGCETYWRVGEHQPPWPQPLEPDAYAQVRPTVETPGLDGGHVAIAGGRIDDHGVYIDVIVETREDYELGRSVSYISRTSYFGDEPGERWFTLSHTTGEAVRVLPRERPRYKGWLIPIIDPAFGHLDRLNAAPDLSRYNMVVWYRTEDQLEPGTYILHVPDVEGINLADARQRLGLGLFDGTEIELRYMEGFAPDDGED